MVSNKSLPSLVLLLFFALSEPALAQLNLPFSFSLSNSSNTSAGVFTKDGTLIKTLWSGKKYNAGNYTEFWDGTADDGRLAPNASYDVRVLSNNVTYTWDGVIGNTSSASSGPTVHHFFERMYGMAISGSSAYFSTGYNEGSPSQAKFFTSSPQVKVPVLPSSGTGQSTLFLTTDGVNVYYGGSDPFSPGNSKWFVYGTKTSDDTESFFSNGTSVSATYGRTYPSAIDVITDQNATITGMAVQKTAGYLFVSHKNLNEIHVLNKNTGALVQKLAVNAPRGLTVDNNNNLWIIYTNGGSPALRKFTVQPDGTLSGATLSLPGLADPLAIAVSPDGNTIVVADGGANQQLKAFDNNSGNPSWTFGQPGGYLNDPTVANDKFYFSDVSGGIHESFIAFQPDGSFWVGDIGNYRALHFSANRTFIDRLMFLRNNYSIAVDPNNPSRVFAEYLEFYVDYSKPLAPDNGSWTLVRNWRAAIPAAYYQGFIVNVFRSVTTLSNNRTYAILENLSTKLFEIVELPPAGPVRFTGITTGAIFQILPDGSQARYVISGLGSPAYWEKYPLTGFDGSNNPLWVKGPTLATTPVLTGEDPVDWGSRGMTGGITSSGVVISFDKDVVQLGHGYGYHLGGIRVGDNKWVWRTAKSTRSDYQGEFPADGSFDVGNTVQYPGGAAVVLDRNILWGYHGEFWKSSQVNKWNHVYDDGLFVGQFGVTGPEVKGQEAAPMMAGNTFSASFVKGTNGEAYLYHNDESHHSALHRWKISGLNTIQEQVIPVVNTPSGQGLLGQYYENNALNNINIKKSRIDATVNDNPVPSEIQNVNNYSTRWTGFVLPVYSQSYTFYTNSNRGVRLWIDDKLIIDNWANTGQIESKGAIGLEAGKKYRIKLETNGSNGSLSWSSSSQPKEIIPSTNLIPASIPETANGVDLMEGLWFNNVLQDGLYGWSRNPVNEDYTGPQYMRWWSVKSGVKAYDQTKSPDVSVNYAQNSGTYTVNRDLGTNNNLNSWKLSGSINYEGNNANSSSGEGGIYFEVLDAAGKVITQFYTTLFWNNNVSNMSVTANKVILAQGLSTIIEPVLLKPQPIDITVANGIAKFTYAAYPAITAPVFDPTSNWQTPKTMRMYFWTSGSNYSRSIDLESMRFSVNNNVSTPPISCSATGSILREVWDNVDGSDVSGIPLQTLPSSTSQITVLETPNSGQQYYGARIRGYICPPQSGNYTFTVAGDDGVALWLSTDDNPANKVMIAGHAGWTLFREWTKYPSQKSIAVNLQQGKRYYIEVLHKQGWGGDNVSVSWQLPDGTTEIPVSGSHLSPYIPVNTSTCTATGNILREVWANVDGSSVSGIPVQTPPTTTNQLTVLETPNSGQQYYGARIRGYLCPPQSGNYTFSIAGDDDVALWLSTDDKPANKIKITSFEGWTMFRDWNKYPSQKSGVVNLQQGKRYYVEVLHKQSWGGDHVSVAWQLPDGTSEVPISGSHLSPYEPFSANLVTAREINLSPKAVPVAPEPEESRVVIYPNPAQSILRVQHPVISRAGDGSLAIISSDGRILKTWGLTKGLKSTSIDVRFLDRGLYFLKFKNTSSTITIQFIKQ